MLEAHALGVVHNLPVDAVLIVQLLVGIQEEVQGDEVGEGDVLSQGIDALGSQRGEQLLMQRADLRLRDLDHGGDRVEPGV